MRKGSNQQKEIILNIYAVNIRESKYTNLKLIGLTGEMDFNTATVGNF